MGFIKLSDDYINDEKIYALSNGAFRLWHEAFCYCQRQNTDGLIPFLIMKGFKTWTKQREKELSSALRPSENALWILIPAMGYRMHNYLKWNLSKEERAKEKAETRDRVSRFRARRSSVASESGNAVTPPTCNADVQERSGEERVLSSLEGESERKPITALVPTARSKRPIFSGRRFVVFEWMLADLLRVLGPHAEAFDLHEWFFTLDKQAAENGLVVPQRDGGQWLQAQTLAEARRRGLPIATVVPPEQRLGKQSTRLMAALANLSDERVS